MKLTRQILRGPLDLAIHAMVSPFVNRHHILLACMPKSGSTYLSNVIGCLPDFRKTSLVTHYGRTDQDIDFRLALRKSRYNYVCQHHVQHNEKTKEAIDRFHITPVVLVRNIFDCVPSIRDHLRREAPESPTAYFFESHTQMDDRSLDDMIVQLAIPWYIQFYVSWTQCDAALWVTYDQLTESPESTVQKIMGHAGVGYDMKTIKQALAAAEGAANRKNVGRSGRGNLLPEELKQTIRSYCAFYPDVDFSLIGIEKDDGL